MHCKQRGFSLIELLIAVAIILIIAAIAVPNLLRSRMAANEASAVSAMRTINTAASSYNSMYSNGFPPSLTALGTGGTTVTNCTSAQLIDETLSSGTKGGYLFQFQPGLAANQLNSTSSTCAGAYGYTDGYMVTAVPIMVGNTGQRSFCTDSSGVIRFNMSGTANPGPSPTCSFVDGPIQ